uniref:Uncharacterized protein n=1 Tax=Arabidopsis thaliana TaxID=3702 RepID=Q56X85_ARATH|nr:hypothetical protein [Arabidopsis thaliana]
MKFQHLAGGENLSLGAAATTELVRVAEMMTESECEMGVGDMKGKLLLGLN